MVVRVSLGLRVVAERVLCWELRVSRAAQMVAARTGEAAASAPALERIVSGWLALAKVLLFCCGMVGARCRVTLPQSPALSRRCAGGLLYMSDPCEHAVETLRKGEEHAIHIWNMLKGEEQGDAEPSPEPHPHATGNPYTLPMLRRHTCSDAASRASTDAESRTQLRRPCVAPPNIRLRHPAATFLHSTDKQFGAIPSIRHIWPQPHRTSTPTHPCPRLSSHLIWHPRQSLRPHWILYIFFSTKV